MNSPKAEQKISLVDVDYAYEKLGLLEFAEAESVEVRNLRHGSHSILHN